VNVQYSTHTDVGTMTAFDMEGEHLVRIWLQRFDSGTYHLEVHVYQPEIVLTTVEDRENDGDPIVVSLGGDNLERALDKLNAVWNAVGEGCDKETLEIFDEAIAIISKKVRQ
jgi:hypothetical protein